MIIWAPLQKLRIYAQIYGPLGILLRLLGSDAVWKMQIQVLMSGESSTALDFKQTSKEECNSVAVTVDPKATRPHCCRILIHTESQSAILIQIAVTALSLADLDDVHWTARGFLIISLVTSLMSVYCASRQYRILGRCLTAEDVRAWIRRSSDPQDLVPAFASVVTISAPIALLSASVHGFLIAFGIYLGFLKDHTETIEDGIVVPDADNEDNKAVFITYIATLGVSYLLYAVCSLMAGDHVDHTNPLHHEALRNILQRRDASHPATMQAHDAESVPQQKEENQVHRRHLAAGGRT